MAKGNQMWFYNGGRPHVGAIINDAPATDTRMIPWAAFKEDINTYFYWHVCHWYHNSQFGPGIDSPLRKQNIWQNTITYEKRPQYNEWANGDGVLIYPGRELIHPEEDRGIDGPVSSVRMANFRRGLQDHLYLSMARERGLTELISEALDAIVPQVFTEVQHDEAVQYELDPDVYTYHRYKLGKAIEDDHETNGWTEGKSSLSSFKIFPNPVTGDRFNIRFQAESHFEIQIDLFNLQGQWTGRLLETRSHDHRIDQTINLRESGPELSPGMYLLQIIILYGNYNSEKRITKIIKT
jgi:hypothetical protein